MKKKKTFDYESFKEQAISSLKSGKTDLIGKEGVFTPLLKTFLEACLDGELEDHLRDPEHSNRKNGKGRKKLKTSLGSMELETPRDRAGSFSPQIVPKRQSTLGEGLDRQILTLFIGEKNRYLHSNHR